MRKESGKIKTNEKTPKAFAYDDPDCVVFINQYYIQIREWLHDARTWRDGPLSDRKAMSKPEYKIDLSSCKAKLVMSLIDNLKKMFPKDIILT